MGVEAAMGRARLTIPQTEPSRTADGFLSATPKEVPIPSVVDNIVRIMIDLVDGKATLLMRL